MDITPPEPRPTEERFFVYWDGSKKVLGDPIRVGRALEKACPDYVALLDVVSQKAPESMTGLLATSGVGADLNAQKDDANARLLAATRTAFGVREATFEGDTVVGLGEEETCQLLLAFVCWMSRAADDARPFSTSQPRDAPSTQPGSTQEHLQGSGSVAG